VVTGIIATLFFVTSILMITGAGDEHRKADECARNYTSSCYDVSDGWAQTLLILGVWMMLSAISLGLATMAPFGAWGPVFLLTAIGILVGPWAIGMAVYLPVVSAVLLAITAVFIILVRVEDRRKARGPGNARSQR
jgi:uncharacterized membrane protein